MGTPNYQAIYSMYIASKNCNIDVERLQHQRQSFEEYVTSMIPGSLVLAKSAKRVLGISNIYFPGVSAVEMTIALDQEGVYASRGSACTSENLLGSHVVYAMMGDTISKGVIRFSFSFCNNIDLIELGKVVISVYNKLKES